MLDLLGDEVIAVAADPDYGFEQAWQAYPAGPRRVAKRQCLKKWCTMGLASQAAHIIAHIRHMKTEDAWLRGFVPMFATYLNQERWAEWEPVVKVEKPVIDPALTKITEDRKKAVKPSQEIRDRMAALRRGVSA